jgi:hypothetical protein
LVFYDYIGIYRENGPDEVIRTNLFTLEDPITVSYFVRSLGDGEELGPDIFIQSEGSLVNIDLENEIGQSLALAHIAMNGLHITLRKSEEDISGSVFVENRFCCLLAYGLMEKYAPAALVELNELIKEGSPAHLYSRAAYPWKWIDSLQEHR